MGIGGLEVLPPVRESQPGGDPRDAARRAKLAGALFALALGRPLFGRLAALLDTKRTLLLALCLYVVIAVWGFMLDAVMEFWFLAFMVAIVQGGSQALSRSLYAGHVPGAAVGRVLRVLLDHGEVLVVLRTAALRRRDRRSSAAAARRCSA